MLIRIINHEAIGMFNFHYEKVGKAQDILAVVVSGSLDESNGNYLLDCVKEEVLDGRKKLILDCSQLTYISSLGLGVLARVHSRMKKIGGDVKLAGVHGTVATLLNIVQFGRLFHFYPTVDEAIAAHGG
jgi:anti-anti-sigma factor